MNSHLLPDGIAPHEDAEYQLMAAGKKHLAMFSDLIPEEFIDNPASIDMDTISNPDGTCTIFYMRGHNAEATRLMELNLSTRGQGYIPEVEREIGRLLGYEEWEINAFLNHVNRGRIEDDT